MRRLARSSLNACPRVAAAAIVALTLGAAAPSETSPSAQIRFDGGTRSTGWMPFDFPRGSRIVFPGRLDRAPTRFLLDSGAEVTVVDTALAARAGLRADATIGFTDRRVLTRVPLVRGVSVRIGTMTLSGLTVAIVDLSETSRLLGLPVEAILGREVFERAIVDIDFERARVAFRSVDGFAPPSTARKVALRRLPSGRGRAVDVAMEDRPPVALEFDLGAASPIMLHAPYWSGQRLLDGRAWTITMSGGAGGVREAKLVALRRVHFGGVEFRDADAVLEAPAGAIERRLGDGVIGMPILSRFRVTTDYDCNTLYLVPQADAARPLPRNRSGLRVLQRDAALEVLLVAANSPAERAGWRAGERIVAIDGRPIDTGFWRSDRWRWSERAAGTTVRLTLADGTIRQLVLADYY